MAVYKFNHVHIYTRNPMATAKYYERMFGAEIIESVQSDGKPRIDLNMNGVSVFLLKIAPETEMPDSPAVPHLGLDHFGFTVDNLDKAAAELKLKGAVFTDEPHSIRPGVRIAYIQAPENVRVELVERS